VTDTPTLVAPLRLFLLTFLFAVPFWILGFLVESPDAVPMAMPVSALMFVCPAIAATLLAWQEGRSAAVRALWGRLLVPPRPRRWVWYAAIPLVSAGPVLTHLLLRFAGEPASMPQPTLPGVLALVCVYLGAAAAEEVGWTAYATDALRARHGALTTALVIGVVSAAWHVVPWSQVHPPDWVAWQFLATVALRVLWTWVYVNTGASVAAVVVSHMLINLWGTLTPTYHTVAAHATSAVLTALAAGAVVVLWEARTLTRLRWKPRPPQPEPH